ncbi:MAG: spore germination protein [Clostridia bacterium]|nr:spore germination protein [Clostridia bacterium]
MESIKKLGRILGFGRKRSEFELLETESGEPGFFREKSNGTPEQGQRKAEVDSSLEVNLERIKNDYCTDINPDVVVRRFTMGGKLPAAAVFINGMAKRETINDFIIRESMEKPVPDAPPYAQYLINNVLSNCEMSTEKNWDKVKGCINDGLTVVLVEGEAVAMVADTRGYEYRPVGAPQNEKVVRGPQEGFNENIRTNITLIRRMIRREDLICEFREVGSGENIKAAVVYLKGTANPALVQEVKRRLARVDTRMVMNTGILEQLTEHHRFSPFPQLLCTERPDRAASHIMQGYVVVLLDGSPFANIMPTTLFALMASSEDVYLRQLPGSIIRFIRYMGAIVSILLPGFFLSLVLYHQGMMSTEALSTVVASRKMVFAPIGLELLFLLAVFQLIREAGLRVPGSIGQAIGIIGGLILGQAAVTANLASSVMLIVVALSGLGNFCIPDYSTQISASYIRIALVAAAWMAGLLGVFCVMTGLLAMMCGLKSYGVPFLAPVAPKTNSRRPPVLRGPITMHSGAKDFINTMEEQR